MLGLDRRGLVLLALLHTAACLHPSLRPVDRRVATAGRAQAPMATQSVDEQLTFGLLAAKALGLGGFAQHEAQRVALGLTRAKAEAAALAVAAGTAAAEFARMADEAAASVARAQEAEQKARDAETAMVEARAMEEQRLVSWRARAQAEELVMAPFARSETQVTTPARSSKDRSGSSSSAAGGSGGGGANGGGDELASLLSAAARDSVLLTGLAAASYREELTEILTRFRPFGADGGAEEAPLGGRRGEEGAPSGEETTSRDVVAGRDAAAAPAATEARAAAPAVPGRVESVSDTSPNIVTLTGKLRPRAPGSGSAGGSIDQLIAAAAYAASAVAAAATAAAATTAREPLFPSLSPRSATQRRGVPARREAQAQAAAQAAARRRSRLWPQRKRRAWGRWRRRRRARRRWRRPRLWRAHRWRWRRPPWPRPKPRWVPGSQGQGLTP